MPKIVLLLLCGFTLNAFAQTCQQGNVYDDIECYKKEKSRLSQILNTQYQELKTLDSNGSLAKEFEKSQTLWNKFVEADCQFINAPASEAQGAGMALGYHACVAEKFKQRTTQLKEFLIELRSGK